MLEILFAIFLSVFAVISATIGVGYLIEKNSRNKKTVIPQNTLNKKHVIKGAQFNISFQELAEIKRVIGTSGKSSNEIEEEYRAMIT